MFGLIFRQVLSVLSIYERLVPGSFQMPQFLNSQVTSMSKQLTYTNLPLQIKLFLKDLQYLVKHKHQTNNLYAVLFRNGDKKKVYVSSVQM